MRSAILILVILISGTGCAQVMAVRQPKPIDREVFVAGMSRSEVSARLGDSVTSDSNGDVLVESYKFTDGGGINSGVGKAFRVLIYTAGDVFTLFLSQVIWIPIELVLDGTEYMATVDYKKDDSNHWSASRIVEMKLDGDRDVAVLFESEIDTNSAIASEEEPVADSNFDTALITEEFQDGESDLGLIQEEEPPINEL